MSQYQENLRWKVCEDIANLIIVLTEGVEQRRFEPTIWNCRLFNVQLCTANFSASLVPI